MLSFMALKNNPQVSPIKFIFKSAILAAQAFVQATTASNTIDSLEARTGKSRLTGQRLLKKGSVTGKKQREETLVSGF